MNVEGFCRIKAILSSHFNFFSEELPEPQFEDKSKIPPLFVRIFYPTEAEVGSLSFVFFFIFPFFGKIVILSGWQGHDMARQG